MKLFHRAIIGLSGFALLCGGMATAGEGQAPGQQLLKNMQQRQARRQLLRNVQQRKARRQLLRHVQQKQGQGQIGQSLTEQQKIRVAIALAYLNHKCETEGAIRKAVLAKVASNRVKEFAEEIRERFAEHKLAVVLLAKRLNLRIEEFKAENAEDKDDMTAESTFMEKLQSARSEEGDGAFLEGMQDWATRIVTRVASLKEDVVDTEASALLERIETAAQKVADRAEELQSEQSEE